MYLPDRIEYLAWMFCRQVHRPSKQPEPAGQHYGLRVPATCPTDRSLGDFTGTHRQCIDLATCGGTGRFHPCTHSQADSAGSIPVTRSVTRSKQRPVQRLISHDHRYCPSVPATKPPCRAAIRRFRYHRPAKLVLRRLPASARQAGQAVPRRTPGSLTRRSHAIRLVR